MKLINLSILLVSFIILGCNGGESDSTFPNFPVVGDDSSEITENSEIGENVTVVDNTNRKDISKTDLSQYLYKMKNLCGTNTEKSMFSWKAAHTYPESEKDDQGFRDGIIMNILLFEDFTYLLRVWNARILEYGVGTYSAWIEPEVRDEIEGEWTAHYNSSLSLDIGIRGSIFKYNDVDTLDLGFSDHTSNKLSDIKLSNIWFSYSIVDAVFDEDLSCEEE